MGKAHDMRLFQNIRTPNISFYRIISYTYYLKETLTSKNLSQLSGSLICRNQAKITYYVTSGKFLSCTGTLDFFVCFLLRSVGSLGLDNKFDGVLDQKLKTDELGANSSLKMCFILPAQYFKLLFNTY